MRSRSLSPLGTYFVAATAPGIVTGRPAATVPDADAVASLEEHGVNLRTRAVVSAVLRYLRLLVLAAALVAIPPAVYPNPVDAAGSYALPFATGTSVKWGSATTTGLHPADYPAWPDGTTITQNNTGALDLLAAAGTAVKPLADGVVKYAWPACEVVLVDHHDGQWVQYLHIDVQVSTGQSVTRSTTLGTVLDPTKYNSHGKDCGNHGTAPHVHFAFAHGSGRSGSYDSMVGKVLCGQTVSSSGTVGSFGGPGSTFTVPNCGDTVQPGCSGGPGADEICLFADKDYGGSAVKLGIGNYPDPGSFGSVGNDNAESIQVGSTAKVHLCQDSNYGGTCSDLSGSSGSRTNLGDNPVGANKVSSLQVTHVTPPPPPSGCSGGPGADEICLFADKDYGGSAVKLGIGNYPDPGSFGSVGNDNAESIQVGSTAKVHLCQDSNYGGTCSDLSGSSGSRTNLGDNPVGANKVSSLQVTHVTPPPPPSGCSGGPGADEICLFADKDYGGSAVKLGIGNYPDPGSFGSVGNDNAESIQVGSTAKVHLCQDSNYGGTCSDLSGSSGSRTNLGDNPVGANKVSSLQVTHVNPPPPPDTSPPTASWDAPADHATITGSSVSLQAHATDSGGSHLANIAFSAYWSGGWHVLTTNAVSGDSASTSYTFDLCARGVPDGDIELGLEAHDQAGNHFTYSEHLTNHHITKSHDCTPPDTSPPTASWDAPADHATITGSSVSLQAHATDSGGSHLANIAFSAYWSGGWHVLTTNAVSGDSASTSYTFDLCARGVPDGDIELGLEAHDQAGNHFTYSEHLTNHHITKSHDCHPTAPAKPTNARVSGRTTTTITLRWTDASTNEKGFRITRFDWDSGAKVPLSVGPNVTTFTDPGLPPDTYFYYGICAWNDTGDACVEDIEGMTAPVTIVIDDKGPYADATGFTPHSTHTSTSGYARQMRWAYVASGAWGSWDAGLQTGRYKVQVWIPSANTSTHKAKYRIYYKGGTVTVTKDQSRYANQWVTLGTWTFDLGTEVRLSANTGERRSTNRKIGWDAIRFVPIASSFTGSGAIPGASSSIRPRHTTATMTDSGSGQPASRPEPDATPIPEPTPEVTPEPTPEVTPEPTPEVTPEPTPEVTPEPTAEPAPESSPESSPAA